MKTSKVVLILAGLVMVMLVGVIAVLVFISLKASSPEADSSLTTPPTTEPTTVDAIPSADQDVPLLAGTSWMLIEAESAPISDRLTIALRFDEETFSGKSCNAYAGSYQAESGQLTFGQINTSFLICDEPQSLMEQEFRYFELLSQVTRYTVQGDRLILGSSENESLLVFVPGGEDTTSGDWVTYENATLGFGLDYPETEMSLIRELNEVEGVTTIRIDLPFLLGTTLHEKYIQVDGRQIPECTSPFTLGYAPGTLIPEPVTVNGIDWVRESNANVGAGNIYEFTSYSVVHNDMCVTLSIILHSTDPGAYATPPVEFDHDAEIAIFDAVLDSFHWLGE